MLNDHLLLLSSVGRLILTKSPGVYDPSGDSDIEEITSLYKFPEGTTHTHLREPPWVTLQFAKLLALGSEADRTSVMRAVSMVEKSHLIYDFPLQMNEDVLLELVQIDQLPYGQPISVTVNAQVRISNPATQAPFCN